MRLLLNGDWTEAPEGESLQALLGRLGIDARRVAVEHNLAIVPKDRYAGTVLAEGDRLEIVHFVGGG
jgi:sulfur carrier protein